MSADLKPLADSICAQIAELTRERDSLRAELDALKGQEPVAWFTVDPKGAGTAGQRHTLYEQASIEHWGDPRLAPLYAAPTPAAADAEALREALRKLVALYVCNPDTPQEFIACYTPEKHQRSKSEAWKAWCAARAALAADAGRAKTEGGE